MVELVTNKGEPANGDAGEGHMDLPYSSNLNQNYQHLTKAEAEYYIEHGWFKVPGAMNEEIVDRWMADLYVRAG